MNLETQIIKNELYIKIHILQDNNQDIKTKSDKTLIITKITYFNVQSNLY